MKDILYEIKTEPFHISPEHTLSPMPHIHKEIELIYIIDGGCTVRIDQKLYNTKSGDLIICFPNQVHFYENSIQGNYMLIIVNPDFVYGLTDILNDNIPKTNIIKFTQNDTAFKLFNEALNYTGDFKKTMLSGCITQSLCSIMSKLSLKPRSKTDNSTLQSIIKYCNSNFTSAITLDDVSNDLHLNKYHISHLFNEKLFTSFNAYINLLRISKACDILQETDMKIADISEDVGFGSIRSFNRAFIQIMDVTPVKYRKLAKEETSTKK